jgi:hypothetical protein
LKKQKKVEKAFHFCFARQRKYDSLNSGMVSFTLIQGLDDQLFQHLWYQEGQRLSWFGALPP